VQRNSVYHLHLCKICKCLSCIVWNGIHSKYWYQFPTVFVNRRLLRLFEITQHSFHEHSFVFNIILWLFVSLKIRYNHNNINIKVYRSRCLSVTDIHFKQLSPSNTYINISISSYISIYFIVLLNHDYLKYDGKFL
jgi:hypothetical protein